MTLQEAETKLSELNTEINKLLVERETILKEWNKAFDTENTKKTICIDECIGDSHNLYLVNGESKMPVCVFDSFDMNGDISQFYKCLDTSIGIHSIANRGYEMSEYQKNLVYAKAIEIREQILADKSTSCKKAKISHFPSKRL